MPEIIESPFRLNDSDPVISAADGVTGTWSDIWKYQVPVGVSLIIKPEHTFSAYLDDSTGSSEVGATDCQVRIEKRDSSGSDVMVLLGPKLYTTVKEFQEHSKLAHFSVPPEGVIVNEREYLVIVVNDTGTIANAYSYFETRIARVRKALGA